MWRWSTFEILVLLVYLILFTSSYLTQTFKIIKNKRRLCIGQTFFTIYSFSLKRIGFFLGSALTMLSLIILSIFIFKYRGVKDVSKGGIP